MHILQICEEGTTSTPESEGHDEELNDLFLPLPLPVLHLLKWQLFFPDVSRWAISPPQVLMGFHYSLTPPMCQYT